MQTAERSASVTEGGAIVRGTPAYRRFSMALLIAGFATFSLLYAVQPLLPLFVSEFGIGPAEASLAVSLATGPMAITLLVAGAISDRFGRHPAMIASLFAAAILTLASAALTGWWPLLAMRFLTGIALAGIPAVAMAYVSEEVDAASAGAAIGLYIAGSAIGGMAGRLGMSLLADYAGWRVALGVLGGAGILAAILFWRLAPKSRGFQARRHGFGLILATFRRLLSDAVLPWLYAVAFLLMGAFVTIYNYVGFRLLEPPYALSQSAVGAVFLLYIVGSFSSAWFGALAGRIARHTLFVCPILILLAGIALTTASPLPLVIIGIGVTTFGFFGAHSLASSWVGQRARQDRGPAASLYLFFYYMGSSVLGSLGGLAWSHGAWLGIALFAGSLSVTALAIAVRLMLKDQPG